METSQPSFPQTHRRSRQAYVFLCLIQGNVKMTTVILKPSMKEMRATVFTHMTSEHAV